VTFSFFETQDGNKGNETCITIIPAKSRDIFAAEFQTTVTIQFDSKLGEVKPHLCSPWAQGEYGRVVRGLSCCGEVT
jgi:hypothetical protein